ncbi:hypothetical protein ACFIQG_21530 [Comamonas odontotermitis]|uniref:hypothetical protein n=1 Tax=Comamonas odontotermitis TaxID=379895 RepID=UPI0036702BCB
MLNISIEDQYLVLFGCKQLSHSEGCRADADLERGLDLVDWMQACDEWRAGGCTLGFRIKFA